MTVSAERIFGPQWQRTGVRARIICFPFAGGSAAAFAPWKNRVAALRGGEKVQILAAELAGRGSRFTEPAADNAKAVAAGIAQGILSLPDAEVPLLLYGHSMGTILAYETARMLQEQSATLLGLVLTGRHAPHWRSANTRRLATSDAELIADMRDLGGTPSEVLASPELLELMLPVIRADYSLTNAYKPDLADLQPPLPIKADIIGGNADARVPKAGLAAWRDLFSEEVTVEMWSGGHFFIFDHRENLLRRLLDRLQI